MNPMGKLGIIAGGGTAPRRLLDLLDRQQHPYFLACLQGHADADLGQGRDHIWVHLGEAEKLRSAGLAAGVDHAVMLGRVRRPSLSELKPDALTLKYLAKIGINFLGDNNLLSAVAKAFEAEGIRIVGVHEIISDWLTPAGVLTIVAPDDQATADIKRGMEVAKLLGQADVGQSVVVQQGIVLALEAVDGTDAMLARAGPLQRDGAAAILVKCSKPQQDKRLDLPAIGLDTIHALKTAGLRGLAIEAGASLMLDKAAVIDAANDAQLFVVGV